MTIGIMGAMDEKVHILQSILQKSKVFQKGNISVVTGKYQNHDVVLAKSGVGKVHAAMCAQILISEFGIEKLLFTGVAGAVTPQLNIGDIVLSIDTLQHDVDATALGTAPGEILFSGGLKIFPACPKLLDLAQNFSMPNLSVISGRVLTGDQFIADKKRLQQIAKIFDGHCVEMEGGAVGQVCHIHQIPFLLIRSISDKADSEAHVDFPQFVKQASRNAGALVKHILANV